MHVTSITSITTIAFIGVGVVAAGRCGKKNQVGRASIKQLSNETKPTKKVRFDKQITVEGNYKSKTKKSLSAESVVNLIAKRKLKEEQKAKDMEALFFDEKKKIIDALPHWVNNGRIEYKDRNRYLNIIRYIYDLYKNEEGIRIIKKLHRQSPKVTLQDKKYKDIR